jgi:hypothetical protein
LLGTPVLVLSKEEAACMMMERKVRFVHQPVIVEVLPLQEEENL